MPRYFFHVHDGTWLRDEAGTELPDLYGARGQAIRLSGEHLRDMGSRFWREMGAQLWTGAEWRMEVADEREQVLFVLRFSAEEVPAPPTVETAPQPGPARH